MEDYIEKTEEDLPDEEEYEGDGEPEEDDGVQEESQETIESLAESIGWVPKRKFKGNTDNYISASDFIKKTKAVSDTLNHTLKENKQKLTSLEKGIEALKQHNDRVYRVQLDKQKEEIDRLRKERREAIEEGDVDRVEAIEEKMTTLAESEDEQQDDPKIDPEQLDAFGAWLKENEWYKVDGITDGNKDLTEYADKLAGTPEYQAMPYSLRIKKVGAKVKEVFPEHFNEAPKRKNVSPVEGPGMKSSGRKFTVRDLSDDQKNIMKNFVRNGIMTEQEYIADLAKIGEIG